MAFNAVFTERAERDFRQLSPEIQKRIIEKLNFFLAAKNPLAFSTRLSDTKIGGWRFRVGDWRMVIDVQDETIIILRIGHRREIYR